MKISNEIKATYPQDISNLSLKSQLTFVKDAVRMTLI